MSKNRYCKNINKHLFLIDLNTSLSNYVGLLSFILCITWIVRRYSHLISIHKYTSDMLCTRIQVTWNLKMFSEFFNHSPSPSYIKKLSARRIEPQPLEWETGEITVTTLRLHISFGEYVIYIINNAGLTFSMLLMWLQNRRILA